MLRFDQVTPRSLDERPSLWTSTWPCESEQGKLGREALGGRRCATSASRAGRVDGDLVDRQAARRVTSPSPRWSARSGLPGAWPSRDQRRAGKAWLGRTVDEHGGRDRGQGSEGAIVWTPAPGMAKSIVTVRPGTLLASRIAWRSEPGPLSAVVSTTKTPSVIRNCVWSGGAPSDWAPRVRVVKTCGPGGRGEGQALQRRVRGRERTAVGQRSGPIARAGQAGGARQRQRPVRDRERQAPDRVERPGIRVLDRDPVARSGRERPETGWATARTD